jgi:hypothetical protein
MDFCYVPPATQSLAHRRTVRKGTFNFSGKVESTVMGGIKMSLDVTFGRIASRKRRLTSGERTSKVDLLCMNLDYTLLRFVVGFS